MYYFIHYPLIHSSSFFIYYLHFSIYSSIYPSLLISFHLIILSSFHPFTLSSPSSIYLPIHPLMDKWPFDPISDNFFNFLMLRLRRRRCGVKRSTNLSWLISFYLPVNGIRSDINCIFMEGGGGVVLLKIYCAVIGVHWIHFETL